MTKSKGKKPTNKDRDKTLAAHESALRQLIPQFNQLHAQVQDFFAVFSMFVEHLGKDESFGKFVEKKLEQAQKEKLDDTPKIVDSAGNPVQASEDNKADSKPVAKGS